MDQKHRRQIPAQNVEIAQIADASLLAGAGALDGARQRREEDGCIVTVQLHQLVEDQMLGSTWQLVEAERHASREGKPGRCSGARWGATVVDGLVVPRRTFGRGGGAGEHD